MTANIWHKDSSTKDLYGEIIKYKKYIDNVHYQTLVINIFNDFKLVRSSYAEAEIVGYNYSGITHSVYPVKNITYSEFMTDTIENITNKYDLNNIKVGIINTIVDLYE